jgi:HD-GYP domain-containing protein (c-di-GMP phosphodiesterase class II)
MTEREKPPADSLFKEVVKTLVSIIEEKDVFIKGHSERVASHCVRFCAKLDLPKGQVEQMLLAGLLHDIGMVYVPIEIIHRPENLTEDETALVKQHPIIAERVLSNIHMLKGILPVIRHHHEAFDGSGYPDNLKGDEIPLGARILRIIDSWDGMTSARPPGRSLSTEEVLGEIEKEAGRQFDIELVKHFLDFIKEGEIAPQEPEEKERKEVARRSVNAIVERFKGGEIDLPVLPKAFQEIQRVMDDPNSTILDLAKAIEKDAAISVKLISVANSPMYRGTERIVTVRDAVPRLGFKETQSIVSAIATKSLYEAKDRRYKDLMEKLWLHSLASAFAARCLAGKLPRAEKEKFFQMGLIHDIGKPPLLKLLSEADIPGEPLDIDAVVESIDEVHTGFGGGLLQRWGFPQDFVRIATRHRGSTFSSKTEQGILATNLANHVAHKLGYALSESEKEVDLLALESTKLLQLDPATIDAICEETKSAMEGISHIF